MMLEQRDRRRTRRAAFTLLEVLIVVAILIVLAGVGGIAMMKYLDDSKKSAAKLQIATLEKAAKAYEIKNGGPPASLDTLLQPDADGSAPSIERAEALVDPWGNHYQYDPTTGRIWATAKDGTVVANK